MGHFHSHVSLLEAMVLFFQIWLKSENITIIRWNCIPFFLVTSLIPFIPWYIPWTHELHVVLPQLCPFNWRYSYHSYPSKLVIYPSYHSYPSFSQLIFLLGIQARLQVATWTGTWTKHCRLVGMMCFPYAKNGDLMGTNGRYRGRFGIQGFDSHDQHSDFMGNGDWWGYYPSAIKHGKETFPINGGLVGKIIDRNG